MGADGEDDTVIIGAEICAGHGGSAELVVRLRYGNGAVGPVILDEATALALLKACNVSSAEELAGQSWRKILEEIG